MFRPEIVSVSIVEMNLHECTRMRGDTPRSG